MIAQQHVASKPPQVLSISVDGQAPLHESGVHDGDCSYLTWNIVADKLNVICIHTAPLHLYIWCASAGHQACMLLRLQADGTVEAAAVQCVQDGVELKQV